MLTDGYYWVRHDIETQFIILVEDGVAYAPGVGNGISVETLRSQIICPVKPNDN